MDPSQPFTATEVCIWFTSDSYLFQYPLGICSRHPTWKGSALTNTACTCFLPKGIECYGAWRCLSLCSGTKAAVNNKLRILRKPVVERDTERVSNVPLPRTQHSDTSQGSNLEHLIQSPAHWPKVPHPPSRLPWVDCFNLGVNLELRFESAKREFQLQA